MTISLLYYDVPFLQTRFVHFLSQLWIPGFRYISFTSTRAHKICFYSVHKLNNYTRVLSLTVEPIMVDNFFLGFAGHAHTRNDLEVDPNKDAQLRKENSVEEAQRLTEKVLDKIVDNVSQTGRNLRDVKLLILYLSYRGETESKDKLICEGILGAVERKFRGKNAAEQLRLIGHTTGGELENEDLVLEEISGVGYNGLSLLALVTNLPIGVGRTWGLRTPTEARDQGREMAREAWVDFSQQVASKEHLRMGKTMLVLTQGSKVDTPGYEHFLAEGIADFIGSTREAKIMNVIGGSSGDGVVAQYFHQFFGRMKEHLQSRILDGEAVCALIPNVSETSIGLDTNGIVKIGREHTFHFDSEKEPHFKYIKRIGREEPAIKFAKVVSENEVKVAKEKGLPIPDRKAIQSAIQEAVQLSREHKRLLIFNPVSARYAFAFPFGNYTCVAAMRMVGDDVELMFPIRSFTPEMPGYIMMGDHGKVQKGAHRVFDMLRADQSFKKTDATLLISCINRRLVELMAGCKSGTEAEILKDGLASSQVIGFLAYGEMSFTNLLQEPYTYGFSCWGMTLHSVSGKEDKLQEATGELAKKEMVHTPLVFKFKTKAAQLVFDHLVTAFIDDYMRRRLFVDDSGWRSLVQIAKDSHVSFRSVYGNGRRRGSAISELERRGLIEVRIFSGKRGRGGRIIKARISYEKETMKRYVDAEVAKNR